MTLTNAPDKTFPITTFLSDLSFDITPQCLSPSPESDPTIRRLVIVGDVHGMRKSLESLLEKVNFNQQKGDHLILVGDLVNKGADSSGVVDLAINLGASAVRGNHDNAVLDAAAEMKAAKDGQLHSEPLTSDLTAPENVETDQSGGSKTTARSIGKRHSATTYNTASELSKHQLEWLASLPLILRVRIPNHRSSSLGDSLVVVHAGLVPNIPLAEQDPHAVMHMRSLLRVPGDADAFMPSENSGEEGWAVEWDRWQEQQASKTTVIFGHDAKRRLQLGRYTIGLDSACLYGHQLSAAVIAAPDGEFQHQIVQVECSDAAYVPPTDHT